MWPKAATPQMPASGGATAPCCALGEHPAVFSFPPFLFFTELVLTFQKLVVMTGTHCRKGTCGLDGG